ERGTETHKVVSHGDPEAREQQLRTERPGDRLADAAPLRDRGRLPVLESGFESQGRRTGAITSGGFRFSGKLGSARRDDNLAYKDLREFIALLESRGELKRITAEVDVDLEIAAITDRVSKAFGPALLFERPRGYRVPVLINALGSETRMNLALEAESMDALAGRLHEVLEIKS